MRTNTKGKQVCVVVGATSKWQAEGRNTLLAHGHNAFHDPRGALQLSDTGRWYVGGYGQVSFGAVTGCPATDECTTNDVRLGLSARYHFSPGEKFDPFLGVGAAIDGFVMRHRSLERFLAA